ncbi:MAG TPA: cell surface protein [Planctomycetaceae bacterium]|nr:cell surface protein [Planctomycetaceae bacterium]HIQ21662.1 cell surface protein [Planctomycetota bacterium]
MGRVVALNRGVAWSVRSPGLGFVLAATVGLFGVGPASAISRTAYLGPTAMAPSADGERLFVALADGRQLAVVGLPEGHLMGRVDLPGAATGVAVTPDGELLYVTCAGAPGQVAVIEADTGRVAGTIPGGHTPCGPALSPDGRRLYVCNRFDHTLWIMDTAQGRLVRSVRVDREPLQAAVTRDGRTVVVIHHLPSGPANRFFIAPVVSFLDVDTGQIRRAALPDGATSVRRLALSPDGREAYVTHILGNYQLVPAQVDGGWTTINALSILDTRSCRRVDTIQLDEQQLGAGNPWGVACSADGRWLCVVHAGSHELSVIDRAALFRRLARRNYASPLAAGIPNRFGDLTGLRRRIRLAVEGPRAIALAGGTAYVAGYFSDALEKVDLAAGRPRSPATIPLGPAPEPSFARRGEMLFHDARICYQHWQSCASCHPDGRADALNWDLLNDGVGNPKNTKSMLLAHRTPPVMSTGVRPSAEAAVRSGLRHILFARRPEEEAAAIDAYLRTLQPLPSPHRVQGRLTPAARRGRQLFFSPAVACHRCHPPPWYTDLGQHDVDTRGPYDSHGSFDTPTLIEVWRTAPYLHDGRFATVQELLGEGKHGAVEELDENELRDLAQFVLSL